ncbi:MAG: FliM/FliN family flagellar motor switch protein [Blastocatellia bacterium]|nr:FliM/FliN family flagellar motor switch protein [Blastocatellia bacterium]
MPESFEKQLFNIFTMAWSDLAPSVVGTSSALSLVAQQEAVGEQVKPALEIVPAFTSGFVAHCSGALSGFFLCLFKKEDRQQLELFVSKTLNNDGPAGVSLVVNSVLTATAPNLPEQAAFGDVTYVDLANAEATTLASQLAAAVGEKAWINTFTLTVGDRLSSQMLAIYAPSGSVEALQATATAESAASAAAASTTGAGNFTSKRRAGLSREDASRNMERLLDVELEVVVRFGLTQIPLRELVRIGVGSMIELNRQVDEPVELLVNNRPLARGSVVVVDGYYGVCITEIGQLEERRQSLTKA